jgi:hypothetical protein
MSRIRNAAALGDEDGLTVLGQLQKIGYEQGMPE